MRTTNRKLEALAAVVADDRLDPSAFATPREQFAGLRASGTTVTELMAGTVRPLPAEDPEVWRILRRSELRRSFGLQAKSCLRDDDRYGCACGEVVFDEIDDADAIALSALSRDERRRELLRRSKPHHIRPPRLRQEPRQTRLQLPEQLEADVPAEPQEANGHVEDPLPAPAPEPEQKPRPRPHRVIRTPKWYDPTPQSFRDMTF